MRGDLPLTTSLLALTALCRAVMADPPHQQARSEALRPRAERRLRWRRRCHDVDPLRPAIAWTATAPALSKRLKSTIVCPVRQCHIPRNSGLRGRPCARHHRNQFKGLTAPARSSACLAGRAADDSRGDAQQLHRMPWAGVGCAPRIPSASHAGNITSRLPAWINTSLTVDADPNTLGEYNMWRYDVKWFVRCAMAALAVRVDVRVAGGCDDQRPALSAENNACVTVTVRTRRRW